MSLLLSESALSKLPFYIFHIDADFCITYLNNSFSKYLNTTVDSVLGKKFSELFDGNIKSGIENYFENKYLHGKGYVFENSIKKGENTLFFEWTINSFNDTERTEFIATACDITAHKEEEKTIQSKMNHLAMLFSFNAGIQQNFNRYNVFKELRELFAAFSPNVNRASILIYEEKEKSLVGEDYFVDNGAAKSEKYCLQPIDLSISGLCYTKNEIVYVNECRTTNLIPQKYVEELNLFSSLAIPINHIGRQIGVLRLDNTLVENAFTEYDIKFFKFFANQVGFFLVYAKLIEDLKNKEQLIEESEKMYRLLVSNLPEIVVIHMNGKIAFVNNAVEGILGYQTDEVIGSDLLKYVSDESKDLIIANIKNRNEESMNKSYEGILIHKNGNKLGFVIRGCKINYKNNNACLVVLFQIA